MGEENLIIAYGTENTTLNKGDQHIILNKKELGYLLKSVLNNVNITDLEVY